MSEGQVRTNQKLTALCLSTLLYSDTLKALTETIPCRVSVEVWECESVKLLPNPRHYHCAQINEWITKTKRKRLSDWEVDWKQAFSGGCRRDGVICKRMPDKVGAIIACEACAWDPAFRCATARVGSKTETAGPQRSHLLCAAVVLNIKSVVRAEKQMSCIFFL